jgi:hypothetical protein
LSWTDNSSYEMGFVIERSKDKNFTTIDRTSTTKANITIYTDDKTTLLKKTTYYYRVFAAADSTGTLRSSPSNVASATTK